MSILEILQFCYTRQMGIKRLSWFVKYYNWRRKLFKKKDNWRWKLFKKKDSKVSKVSKLV